MLAAAALAAAIAPVCSSQAVSGKIATAPAPAATTAPDRAAAYYHYTLAHMYEDMVSNYGRPEYAAQAIEEYKLALQADPNSRDLATGLADMYFKIGRIRDAVVEAQELVKRDPTNLDAHKLLGRIYLRSLGDMDQGEQTDQMLKQAIGEYEDIVKLEPNSVEDHLLLGRLYSANHDPIKAKAQFEAAHKIEPASEDAVLNLARVYAEQGQMNEAIQLLTAVPADHRTPKLELALGGLYDSRMDSKDAIAAYRRSLVLEPDNLDAERSLAQDLLNNNQTAEALKMFQDIAAADPQDAVAYIRMSEILRRDGKYDEALATLKKAKALVSDSLEISYNEALIDDSLGRLDDAADTLQKMVASTYHADGQYSDGERSNRALFLDRLANVYREQNKTDDAAATYRQMIDLGGDNAVRGYQFLVETYQEAHNQPQALAAAKEGAAKFPDKLDLQLTLASLMADSGQADAALKFVKDMLNGKPRDREIYLQLGAMDTRLHRYQDAAAALDSAEKLTTSKEQQIFLDYYRGENFDHQKKEAEAEEQFRKVLVIDPNNALALNYLGFMFADHGIKLDEAVTMLKKAVELDPQNGAYLDSLGWAYFKQGQYPKAEEYLQQAILRLPQDPSLHDHLGQIYEKTDRLKLAAAQWEIAQKLYRVSNPADYEQADVAALDKHLESVRVRLARGDSSSAQPTNPVQPTKQ
jgi:tetratricopeptide (TPR) repeat protein